MEMDKSIYRKLFQRVVCIFVYLSLLTVIVLLGLFPQSLEGKSSDSGQLIAKLEKYVPSNEELVIFFVLPPPEAKTKSAKEFTEKLCNDLFAPLPLQTTISGPGKNGADPFSGSIAAVFAGDEKNGLLLFHLPVSQKSFLDLLKKNVGRLTVTKKDNTLFYSGKAPLPGDKGFILTFVTPDIVALTQNTPRMQKHLYKYITAPKGVSGELKKILKARRSGAFIYGAVKIGSVQKTVSTFFPDAGNLQTAGFDVKIAGNGDLSLNMFITAASRETAQMLMLILNNYKALLTGLLLSTQNVSGNEPGTDGNQSPLPDPNTLVNLRQNGKDISIILQLPPQFIPVLQSLFIPSAGSMTH